MTGCDGLAVASLTRTCPALQAVVAWLRVFASLTAHTQASMRTLMSRCYWLEQGEIASASLFVGSTRQNRGMSEDAADGGGYVSLEPAVDEALLVSAPAGAFRGLVDEGAISWRGIRYAEAPKGEARWRAPVPAAPVEGVVDALHFGPACPQPVNAAVAMRSDARYDEDCLTLNLWVPPEAVGPLPVMVWLHGGAYTYGSSCQPVYNGARLATSGDVVVVTLNYRLGVFGFLDLTRTGEPGDFDGNLALRDVLCALQWVQGNVAAFGGDPDRVTVFGESAGGGLVTTLLATPSAQGLFHGAIAESSPASSVYGVGRAFGVARDALAELGVSVGDASEMRSVPVDELVKVTAKLFAEVPSQSPGTIAFAPVVDGELVPEAPVKVLREGRGLPVPLIIGSNKDEASVFKFMKSPLMPVTDARIREMLADIEAEQPDLPVPELGQIRSAYEGRRMQAVGLGIGRDIGFRLPTLWVAEGHCLVAPVWLYRFDHATPLMRLVGLGATHASEVPYVWQRLDAPEMELVFRLGGRRQAKPISERMSGRWLAFAHGEAPDVAGDPDAPEWPQYELSARQSLVIDQRDRVAQQLDSDIRAGWGDEVISFA